MANKPANSLYANRLYVDEISFGFKVRVRIFLTAFIAATIAVVVYSLIEDKHRKVADFGAAAFGVSLAGASAIHAYRGIVYTQSIAEENKRIERTIDYITKWDDDSISSKRATMKRISQEARDRSMRISSYLDDNQKIEETQDIVSVLNFLEKIAFFVYEGDLHQQKLATYYKDIFESYYDEFYEYIQDRRENKKQPKLYENFVRLHHDWNVNGKQIH